MKVVDEFNDYAQSELKVEIKVQLIEDKKDALATLKGAEDVLIDATLNDVAS